jgi:hypothetical protein
MEDPEACLRALAAPLAQAKRGHPLPVTRFSLESVANAFVLLDLLSADQAEAILAPYRPLLEAAGFRVGRRLGELAVQPATRAFQQARAARAPALRQVPLTTSAGPVRCRLRGHDITITQATVTPEGISMRFHGDPQYGESRRPPVLSDDIMSAVTDLAIADDAGRTYLIPPGHAHAIMSGQCSAPGGTRWIAEGDMLAVPAASGAPDDLPAGRAPDRPPAVRWLEFRTTSGPPVRLVLSSPAAVPTGLARPPWPNPAECYLAEFLPPAPDWGIGSDETGVVQLDPAAIVSAVADALLAVGALPPDSPVLAVLAGKLRDGWQPSPDDGQLAQMDRWASAEPGAVASLGVRLPLERAAAAIENVTAHEDLLSVQLYGHPWGIGDGWPVITPGFLVTATDDTGAEYAGSLSRCSVSIDTLEGSGTFWLWPPVDPRARQLRVTVSTLWEAAWALVDIPGR